MKNVKSYWKFLIAVKHCCVNHVRNKNLPSIFVKHFLVWLALLKIYFKHY